MPNIMPRHSAPKKPVALAPARLIAISFASVIAIGTLLLMLPVSAQSGRATPLLDALFTATSATCVTGLVVTDTATYWSLFGQLVILAMIQIGGLGLVTLTTFFNMLMGKKLGLRSMHLAQESINSTGLEDVSLLVRMVVTVSFCIELLGALLLGFSFVPKYGAHGVYISIFLSVSAFCNAGIDPLGFESPYISLTHYAACPGVLFVIMGLIVIGGLGFMVWADLYEYRRTRKLALHSRVVLLTTAVLIVFGTLGFLVSEWSNPATIGSMSVGTKALNALFSSVTARTAGFNTVDMGAMLGLTKLLFCGLMFIGAAPGSTGGGIKVTTLTVLLMTVVCVVRGGDETVILGRRVDRAAIYKALSIFVIALLAVGLASIVITESMSASGVAVSGVDSFFEAVSAFATVGLSSGVTAIANATSRIALILSMYLGRVGPVSLALALAMRPLKNKNAVLPEGKILVG